MCPGDIAVLLNETSGLRVQKIPPCPGRPMCGSKDRAADTSDPGGRPFSVRRANG